jgi:hypothetical protein
MRGQGVWSRICALVALITVVLPASANVASCLPHSKQVTCCMSRSASVAKPRALDSEPDCCRHKARSSSSSTAISEGKSQCHCPLKSIPGQPTNVSVLNSAIDQFEAVVPIKPSASIGSEETFAHTETIFYSDSGPPDDSYGSATHGRAPPVTVL